MKGRNRTIGALIAGSLVVAVVTLAVTFDFGYADVEPDGSGKMPSTTAPNEDPDEGPLLLQATGLAAGNETDIPPEPAAVPSSSGPGAGELPVESSNGAPALEPVMLTGDFPLYLTVVARPTGEIGGVREHTGALLTEMAEEPRDAMWANRMERELREFIGPHPHGFHDSVGCRASICQVSVVGEPSALAEDSGAAESMFWYYFRQGVEHSGTGDELGFSGYVVGVFPTHPPQHIAAMVLTSAGRDVPPGCRTFRSPPDSDDP
jgi:hypothetical protein